MTATATTPVLEDIAKAACQEITKLQGQAQDVIDEGLEALQEVPKDARAMRATEHEILAELVDSASWLARDLVGVLVKVAGGEEPQMLMRSDLARRIHEAEVRLELLRRLS